MGKKKKFFDEYDELFVRAEGGDKNSLKPKKKVAESKPKIKPALKPNKKAKSTKNRKKVSNKFKTIGIGIVCLVIFLGYYGLKKIDSPLLGSDTSFESKSIKPLKIAGIKATEEIDYSLPLAVTEEENGFTFNRGYQLEIKGDWDNEDPEGDKAVLPSKEDYVYSKEVANLKFYDGRDFSRSAQIEISGNITKSFSSWLSDRRDFTKVYPQEKIDGIMTGYIIECEYYENSSYGNIYRYFVFPDGTGIQIRTSVGYDVKLDLTPDSTFSEFKKVLAIDYKFLSEDFVFSKIANESTDVSNIAE
ncbi:hypothetical protein [Enterococcus alishanensis]|uniref:Uncharacterized protein n=1 Tax=Enterococcus alishanensis TaxID=1303817 RepID=A0ABS6TA93_9ENTE|nr:hypothetical protein [Enterococcus alishanensis]MBV7389827.1 hypothetical protein [Enterococcus alishanensis]